MQELLLKLNKITNSNYKDRFTNELLDLESKTNPSSSNDENNDNKMLSDRINSLKLIVSNFDRILLHNEINNDEEIKKPITFFAETDKLTYSRKWKKLLPIHKIIKIKEYFNFLPQTAFKDELIAELESVINTKKFKDPDHIIYDHNLQRITSIPCIELNSTSVKSYKINLD